METKLITKKALAKKLECTTRHVDNLTRKGIIPKIKLGNYSRYDWEDVVIALKNQTTEHPPSASNQQAATSCK